MSETFGKFRIGAGGPGARITPARAFHVLHPAVDLVKDIEALWEPDDTLTRNRARMIVGRLIEAGYLRGRMEGPFPVLDQEPVNPDKQPPP